MLRVFIVILFLATSQIGNCQRSSLIKNVNFRAKDLIHELNHNGDTLKLESDKTIYQVDIYNSFYEKKLAVNRYKSNIPINDLPEGRYVVEAKLSDRHIIMTLIRNETAKEALALSDAKLEDLRLTAIETQEMSKAASMTMPVIGIEESEQIIEEETVKIDEQLQLTTIALAEEAPETIAPEKTEKVNYRNYSPADLLNTRLKKPSERSNKYFWVELEVNNGNSSSKTKKLVHADLIAGLILHNKTEIKTAKGRNNKLTIWEVFDTKAFMIQQRQNRNFVTSVKTSDCFNPIPYYATRASSASR
ncbi:hypothetical protein [Winogradskyella alexanderae]|uniref:Uncharacterized protein n=1 Tax=Winogradskyella alexanderae TaxID=2877123 RepID=A0ABS7XTE0_9FLAO|nr:hypothetical protein [Winogradskyella alexanderae]MCA0133292.1 hypothetical protein [Winogradskyella alexanderae]